MNISNLTATEVPIEGDRFRRIVFTDENGQMIFEFSLRPSGPSQECKDAMQAFVDEILEAFKG